jgi:hypothetical protein
LGLGERSNRNEGKNKGNDKTHHVSFTDMIMIFSPAPNAAENVIVVPVNVK